MLSQLPQDSEAESFAGLLLRHRGRTSLTLDADGIWSVDFDPHRFPPIDSNLYVYAHSAVTGKTLLKVVHFFLENRPT